MIPNENRPQLKKLHHFGISVSSIEDTIKWYTEKLGFTVAYRYEIAALNAQVAFLKLSDFEVEIFEIAGAAPLPESSRAPVTDLPIIGVKHIAIAVDDIEQVVENLKSKSVSFLGEIRVVPNSNGRKFIFFQDNNGIIIELFQ